MVVNILVHSKIGQMHFKAKVDSIVHSLGLNHLDHQVECPHLEPLQNLRLPHLEPHLNLKSHHLVPLLQLLIIREKLMKKHQIWLKCLKRSNVILKKILKVGKKNMNNVKKNVWLHLIPRNKWIFCLKQRLIRDKIGQWTPEQRFLECLSQTIYRTRANKGRSILEAAPLRLQTKMHFLCVFYVITLRLK